MDMQNMTAEQYHEAKEAERDAQRMADRSGVHEQASFGFDPERKCMIAIKPGETEEQAIARLRAEEKAGTENFYDAIHASLEGTRRQADKLDWAMHQALKQHDQKGKEQMEADIQAELSKAETEIRAKYREQYGSQSWNSRTYGMWAEVARSLNHE